MFLFRNKGEKKTKVSLRNRMQRYDIFLGCPNACPACPKVHRHKLLQIQHFTPCYQKIKQLRKFSTRKRLIISREEICNRNVLFLAKNRLNPHIQRRIEKKFLPANLEYAQISKPTRAFSVHFRKRWSFYPVEFVVSVVGCVSRR